MLGLPEDWHSQQHHTDANVLLRNTPAPVVPMPAAVECHQKAAAAVLQHQHLPLQVAVHTHPSTAT
jgi:hypothetical protein